MKNLLTRKLEIINHIKIIYERTKKSYFKNYIKNIFKIKMENI